METLKPTPKKVSFMSRKQKPVIPILTKRVTTECDFNLLDVNFSSKGSFFK